MVRSCFATPVPWQSAEKAAADYKEKLAKAVKKGKAIDAEKTKMMATAQALDSDFQKALSEVQEVTAKLEVSLIRLMRM